MAGGSNDAQTSMDGGSTENTDALTSTIPAAADNDSMKTQSKSLPAAFKCKYFFIVFLIGVLLFIHTGLIATKYVVKYEVSVCNIQQPKQNFENTTTETLTAIESKAKKQPTANQPEKNGQQKYFRLSHVLILFCSILSWFEYGYLFYGGYLFLRTASQWKYNFHESLIQHTKVFMLKKKIKLAVAVISFMLLIVASLVPPICGLITAIPNKQHCLANIIVVLIYAYHTCKLLVNILSVLARIAFAFFAVTCGAIWCGKIPKDDLDIVRPKIQVSLNKGDQHRNEDLEKAGTEYFECVTDYEARLTKVRPVYKIFRSWFMFQWVRYLFLIFISLAYLLRPWLLNKKRMETEGHALHIFSHILMLICSYVFALKMNSYLRRYIRKKQKSRMEHAKSDETGSKLWYAFTDKFFPIERIPKSEFTPNIPGTGINISLGSPGFILGTLLTVMGTVFTLSNF